MSNRGLRADSGGIGLVSKWSLIAGLMSLLQPLAYGQNFGSPLALSRKRIVLVRKLPPTGHVEGTGIKVVVTGGNVQPDVATTLKSDLENILLRNDPRLRTEDVHPDTTITCTITSYAQPVPTRTQQSTLSLNKKKPAQPQYEERVTATLTAGFKAQSRSGHTLAADNVKSKYDQEFSIAPTGQANTGLTSSIFHSMSSAASHVAKAGERSEQDSPPTAVELRDKLIQDAAMQIASHLVNTSEQVSVNLARGGALDQPVKLMESQLWTRALEDLMTMPPYSTPEEDSYRLYDIGVADEALAYSTDDFNKARTYLQQAAINYGKAIDGKPAEKNFLEPQNRIDTALAHYKSLSDESKGVPREEVASTHTSPANPDSGTPGERPTSSADAMTNDQVMEMVAAHIDEANIIDDIQHAPDVHFDLSVEGQVSLSKHGVNGRVLTAMKARARGGSSNTHRASR